MKTLKEFILESRNKVYCVMCRITTSQPYSSFLFANNIWCDGNKDKDEIIDEVMNRLKKHNGIFKEFPRPTLQEQNTNGGCITATSTLNNFTLKLTFLFYDYNTEGVNVTKTSPIFEPITSRWSETKDEKENRYKQFDKSGFNEFCKEKGYNDFSFK